MSARLVVMGTLLALAALSVSVLEAQDRAQLTEAQNRAGQQIMDRMLARLDPYLIREAEELGLYDREALPVFRGMNPFFLRGDFNGDGGMDVAFWVREPESGLTGVAILHSTLDTLFVYGAGRPGPSPRGDMANVWLGRPTVDTWHVIPAGHVKEHHYGNIPSIGVVEESSFTFERETLEFVFLGKSAFVFYWADGRYWMFWTAD